MIIIDELTCVNVGMFLHVRFLVEAFPTELTRIWSGIRMDEQVSGQGRGSLKGLAALMALEHRYK